MRPGNNKWCVGWTCLSLLLAFTLVSCGKMESFNTQLIYKSASRAHNKGDYKTAIELYTKILKNHPELSTVRYELGVAYLDTRQFREAHKQIKILRDQNRDDLAVELEKLSETAIAAR